MFASWEKRIIMIQNQLSGKLNIEKSSDSKVLFKKVNSLGIISLNNPRQKNTFNLEMISKIREKVDEWEENHEFSLIWLDSTQKEYLCVGGLIVHLIK